MYTRARPVYALLNRAHPAHARTHLHERPPDATPAARPCGISCGSYYIPTYKHTYNPFAWTQAAVVHYHIFYTMTPPLFPGHDGLLRQERGRHPRPSVSYRRHPPQARPTRPRMKAPRREEYEYLWITENVAASIAMYCTAREL